MEKLELNPKFNREIVPRTISAIDTAPDPDKFGVLSVASMNGHGMYAIYDGGHRFTWLWDSGYRGEVPCVVGRVNDEQQVALKFVEMQHDRRDVSVWERYKKLLFVGIDAYVDVDREVTATGWKVGPKAIEYVVTPTPMLQVRNKYDAARLATVLLLARDLWDGRFKHTDPAVLLGLAHVVDDLGSSLDRTRFLVRLGSVEPRDLLSRARDRRVRERGSVALNVGREITRAYRSRQPVEAA
jgi:hypothetical protein